MTMHTCGRCGGTGKLESFPHVEDGICFECRGSGLSSRKPRVLKDEVADHINWLIKRDGNTLQIAVFYAWDEGTGKQRAGTGHVGYHQHRWAKDRMVDDFEDQPSLPDLKPLPHLRRTYAALRDRGFEPAPQHVIDAFIDERDDFEGQHKAWLALLRSVPREQAAAA